jgi:hypothetical protein
MPLPLAVEKLKFNATNDLAGGMDTQLHHRALEQTLIPLEA